MNPSLTLAESGISDKSKIYVIECHMKGAGGGWFPKEINIKFIKLSKNNISKNYNQQF